MQRSVPNKQMNGLNKDGVKDMRQYLLDLKAQGKTILIALHSAEDIDVLCDTVCEMDKGILTVVRQTERLRNSAYAITAIKHVISAFQK